MPEPQDALRKGDALLVIDVQNDFCPGGALPIDDGDAVVPVLNTWISVAEAKGIPVFASRDWHPQGHVSFDPRGGPWPPHCIQDTSGAAFHPGLQLPEDTIKVTKGTRFDRDQYSAFDQTGLAEELQRAGIGRVWIGGLAMDVCVMATALDAREAGIETHVVVSATRATSPHAGGKATDQMRAAGVVLDAR